MTRNDIDIKDYIRNFLNGCIEVKKRRDAGSTEAKGLPGIIKNKPYRGTYVKQVLQQGKIAYCPFMVFEGHGQVATNGIYPALLFNSQTSVLEICYTCSATEKTNNKWGEIYISGLSKSTTEDYKESLVKKSYTINNDKDIEDNIDDIIDCLDKVIDDFHEQFKGDASSKTDNEDTDLNIILYGPPGTGKTYNTVVEAMKIIAPEKYKEYEAGNDYGVLKAAFDEYRKQNRIEFVTFHQSFSYEEFVEGIKPVIDDESEDDVGTNKIRYEYNNGIFKKICKRASDNLYKRADSSSKEIPFADVIGAFKERYPEGSDFNNLLKISYANNFLNYHYGNAPQARKIDLSKIEDLLKLNKEFSNASEFNSEYEGNTGLQCYHFSFYKELYKIKRDIENQESMKNNVEVYIDDKAPKYVLIIDEINRGNISKIFGELITLIEPDKRIGAEHELRVSLPYTKDKLFGVPKNLYIIGTMNTSDRSIASIDIALRRRFKFKEMMPRDDLVADFGIGFRDIFKKLNLKIKLLLDRDHQIGHSYFMNPKNNNVAELKRIWFDRIIPLLNEYFYCDWEKLKLIIPGFIKPITEVPASLKNECEDNCYEFTTMEEFDDAGFIEALKSEKDEKKSS